MTIQYSEYLVFLVLGEASLYMHQMTQRCTQIDWSASDVSAARWRFVSVPRRKKRRKLLDSSEDGARKKRRNGFWFGKYGQFILRNLSNNKRIKSQEIEDNFIRCNILQPWTWHWLDTSPGFHTMPQGYASRGDGKLGWRGGACLAWKDLLIQPLSYHFSYHSPCFFFRKTDKQLGETQNMKIKTTWIC